MVEGGRKGSLEAALSRDKIRARVESQLKIELAHFREEERHRVSIRKSNVERLLQGAGVADNIVRAYLSVMFDSKAMDTDRERVRQELRGVLSEKDLEKIELLVTRASEDVRGIRGAFRNAIVKDKKVLLNSGYDEAKVDTFLKDWEVAEYLE